jgi:hypothetical protein
MEEATTDMPKVTLTGHAMLVAWGDYGRHIGLVDKLEKVSIPQRKRVHTPQSKLIEFLVAILGGCAYLKDISHGPHPLDQDEAVAEAWGQPAWADYSGVSRTLKACTPETVAEIEQVLREVSQPFIDREVTLALQKAGIIVYDGDLTSRPVSNTSSSYPDARFGWMSDEVGLGFQVALVSMHSPTYGRLWLSGKHHPGDVVSSSQAEALVRAAEARTGVRPRRRTDLLRQRLAAQEQALQAAGDKWQQRREEAREIEQKLLAVEKELQTWQEAVGQLAQEYERKGKEVRPYSKLAKARRKVQTYNGRLQRYRDKVAKAKQRVQKEAARVQGLQAERDALQERLQQFQADNQTNTSPIRAIIRLDGGFGSKENLALLIEMGYEVYSKPLSYHVTTELRKRVNQDTTWDRVGRNAEMVAWAQDSLKDCPYPLDLALERFHTGDKVRYSTLLHYGQDEVTRDLQGWFNFYNGRQTIEAGIKECKSVFQMKRMHVQSPAGIVIQELFALFAANFVRWAAHWLHQASADKQSPLTQAQPKVKDLVRLAANTSAWVVRHSQGCLLKFTRLSAYPGLELAIPDGWAFQPPLKNFFSCKSAVFPP